MDLCPDDLSESSSGLPSVHGLNGRLCSQTAGAPEGPQGLPDDGVTETSAVEVQMGSPGCAAEAEKYDFSLSKLY